MTFIVGTNKDYSSHVIAGSYKVKDEPQYSEWEDTSHRKHKFRQRNKVVGTFDMFFRTLAEYTTFKSDLDAAQSSSDDSYSISVTVNNTGVQKSIYAFIDYDLTRGIDGGWNDYFERFTVKIEER